MLLSLFTSSLIYGQDLDSTTYRMAPLFNSGDTIILTSAANEKLFYQHRIEERQTLYSLSTFFDLDVFTLYEYNPSLNYEIARIGDSLLVPIKPERIITERRPTRDHIKIFYRVKKKDTPFAVRHRMFNIDKEIFSLHNPQSENGISPDELLFIGYMPLSGLEKDSTMVNEVSILSYVQEDMEEKFLEYETIELSESRGMAYWDPKNQDLPGFFVLFNGAPVNSYIKINNPMYNRSAYARVISGIPGNMYQKNVLVVVSPMLANYLGVMDSRFFVNLRYLQLKEVK